MKSKNPQEDCNLRPWTVNPTSEKILVQEATKLDKILTRTTPQKNAGYRGSSALEKLPELADFQSTLKETLNKSPIFSRTNTNFSFDIFQKENIIKKTEPASSSENIIVEYKSSK
jgi:hypothetical protein